MNYVTLQPYKSTNDQFLLIIDSVGACDARHNDVVTIVTYM